MIRKTHSPPSIGWTPAQAEALRTALAAKSGAGCPMGYAELAGFLFAVACAPELVMPTEWLPETLGEGPSAFGSLEEAQRVMNLVMALHNHINLQVLERRPALPAGIAARDDPMENFGPGAPLGQWAQGYSQGQTWLEETWDACLAAEPRADAARIDEALGAMMMALGFFASRGFAESVPARDARAGQAGGRGAADARRATRSDARPGRAGTRPGTHRARSRPRAGAPQAQAVPALGGGRPGSGTPQDLRGQ